MSNHHRLSQVEKTFWINEQIHDSHNHVLVTFVTSRHVDLTLMEKSLRQIIDETPQLHSTIVGIEGEPYWQTDQHYAYPITVSAYDDSDIDGVIDGLTSEKINLNTHYPCRFWLLQGRERHLLAFLFHHVVMDDGSMQLFTARLSTVYNALASGAAIPQTDISQRFNVVDLIEEHYAQGLPEGDIAFWNDYVGQVNAEDVRSYFPESYASHSISTFRFTFDRLQSACRSFCEREKIGPFRLLAAVWSVTVLKVFSHSKLFINYPISIRPKDHQEAIGAFVNDQLLHVAISDDITFGEVLRHVTSDRRQAWPHQYVSTLDSRVADVMRHSEKSIALNFPLGLDQVCLVLGDEHVPLYKRPLTYMPSALQLDVEAKMGYGYVYTDGSYPAFFAQTLADAFLEVLGQVVCDINIAMRDIVLTRQLPLRVSASALPGNQPTLVEMFGETARRCADKTAVIYASQRMTYAELDRLSDRVATEILRTIGIEQTFRYIGVFTPRSINTIALLLGVWKAGYAFVPMDQGYPLERLKHIVDNAALPLVITDTDMPPVPTRVARIDWGHLPEPMLPLPRHDSPAPAYIIYTSGTTGTPKGAPISQQSVIGLIRARESLMPFHDGSVELCFGSISFDASIWSIFTTILSGYTVCLATETERHDMASLLKVVESEHVCSMVLPPTALTYLPCKPLPHLETLITAGDVCPQEAIEKWMQVTTVINAYGPTENTVFSTMKRYHPDEPVCSTNLGLPLPEVDAYVLDDQLNPVPDGVKGTLFLGGTQLTDGYLNSDELNQQKFRQISVRHASDHSVSQQRVYDSGDIVTRMPNGEFLFFGRKDAQVKIRSFRIELAEIETQLLNHSAVCQCAVVVRQQDSQKSVAAYVGVADAKLNVSSLRHYLAESLPQYMIPEYWHIAAALPVNTNGKVDRHRLAELPLVRGDIASPASDANEEEIKCLSLVAKIMGVPSTQIGLDDDLISQVGLNSLHVLELVFMLTRRGYIVNATDVFRMPSVRLLTRFLNSEQSQRQLSKSQIDKRLCYFATTERQEKPLLLIICGYRYYEVNYSDLHNTLKDHYDIVVLESIVEMKALCPNAVRDASALTEEYVRLLRPLLKRRQLAAITGLCIGGDIALQLAVQLQKHQLARPHVFNIDGMACRQQFQGQMGVMPALGISPEADLARKTFAIEFARTIPQHHYSGPVTLFLARRFETIGDFTKEQAEAFYNVNLRNWQQAQPEANIVFFDEVHMQLIHNPQTLHAIKSTIDAAVI